MRSRLRITHWAFLTVALYAATLLILWWPLVMASFCYWGTNPLQINSNNLREFFSEPATWAALSFLALLEGFVLLVPVQIERKRPVSRRRWGLLAVVAALLMGLLAAALIYAIGECILSDAFLGNLLDAYSIEQVYALLPLLVGLLIWTVWGWLFWRYARGPLDDRSRLNRVMRWLVVGSTVDLLVAVPCHVYVRHKDHCCAGFNTFFGIAVGLAVMFFAFGPGAFFLFVRRMRELRRAQSTADQEGLAADTHKALSTQPTRSASNVQPPPRWGGRSRDGWLWCLVGLIFLVFCQAGRWFHDSDAAEMAVIGQVAFLVLWCAALREVWRGAHTEENGAYEAGLLVLACFPMVVWSVCHLLRV